MTTSRTTRIEVPTANTNTRIELPMTPPPLHEKRDSHSKHCYKDRTTYDNTPHHETRGSHSKHQYEDRATYDDTPLHEYRDSHCTTVVKPHRSDRANNPNHYDISPSSYSAY